MPGLYSTNAANYRFGFNGMLRDDDVKEKVSTGPPVNEGIGNSYDFGARIYDPRVERFLSLDPMIQKYPGVSPYNFVENNPILRIDADGKEWTIRDAYVDNGLLRIKLGFSGALISNSDYKNKLGLAIKNQIQTSFKADFTLNNDQQKQLSKDLGFDVPFNVSVTTEANVKVVGDVKQADSKDHLFIVFNPTEYNDQRVRLKEEADFLGNHIFISDRRISDIIKGNDNRTVVHGVGHTAGYLHPNLSDNICNGQYLPIYWDKENPNTLFNAMQQFDGAYEPDDLNKDYNLFNTPQFVRLIDNIINKEVNKVGTQPIPCSTPGVTEN